MQNVENQQQQWQQPAMSQTGAPYQVPAGMTQSQPEQFQPGSQAAYPPQAPIQAPPSNIPQLSPQPDSAYPSKPETAVPSTSANNPIEQDSFPDKAMQDESSRTDITNEDESDGSVVRWQAPEYMQADRSMSWYIVLGVVGLALMILAIFVMKSPTFAVLIPIMVAALVVYMRRPAPIINYVISRKGIHANDKLYGYDQFKSFGVLTHNNTHTVVLVPRKRFELGVNMFIPEDVGESVVDMLAARLPMKDVQPDFFDKIIARLHL